MDAVTELVRMAKEQGLALTGPDGLLKQLTKTVIETGLHDEITKHLAYEKNESAGRESGNTGNGIRGKTVLTDSVGSIDVEVLRDRAGTSEPQIVKKRKRRLDDVDKIVLALRQRSDKG